MKDAGDGDPLPTPIVPVQALPDREATTESSPTGVDAERAQTDPEVSAETISNGAVDASSSARTSSTPTEDESNAPSQNLDETTNVKIKMWVSAARNSFHPSCRR